MQHDNETAATESFSTEDYNVNLLRRINNAGHLLRTSFPVATVLEDPAGPRATHFQIFVCYWLDSGRLTRMFEGLQHFLAIYVCLNGQELNEIANIIDNVHDEIDKVHQATLESQYVVQYCRMALRHPCLLDSTRRGLLTRLQVAHGLSQHYTQAIMVLNKTIGHLLAIVAEEK